MIHLLNKLQNILDLTRKADFAATYVIMLLALLFIGGGRYISVDYWIARRFRHTTSLSAATEA